MVRQMLRQAAQEACTYLSDDRNIEELLTDVRQPPRSNPEQTPPP